MAEPKHNKGRSKQDYQTPPEFLWAVSRKFNVTFSLDAAASPENAVCERFYTEEDNGLILPWETWTWCNPPWGDITPWVRKAWANTIDFPDRVYPPASSMLLIPASVGSNWWRDYVHERALVFFLNGRIKFVGAKDVYPKDCALLLYGSKIPWGYKIWKWTDDV